MDTPDSPYPTRGAALYVAAVLFVATTFSFLDGQLLSLMATPVAHDLHLSDTAMGALYGLAFVLLCSTLGVPIGRLVDKGQRRWILSAGIACWSVMTMTCGLASGFWTLFAARALAGVGMACLSPLSISLLADCFRPQERTRALNVYLLGVFAGQGLSLAMGGFLFDLLRQSPPLPLIGGLAVWRQVFILVGLPGLLLALVPMTMTEPNRQEAGTFQDGDSTGLLAYIGINANALIPVFLSECLLAFTAYSLVDWAPAYFIRAFGLTPGSVGRTLGLMLMACGTTGAILGSMLCDRWITREVPAAKFRVAALGMFLAAPFALALPFVAGPSLAYFCLAACLIALPLASIASRAMVQELFPNRMRGQGSAVALLMQGLLGTGLGPVVVGFVSSRLFTGTRSLGEALALVSGAAILAFVLLYLGSQRSYETVRSALLVARDSPNPSIGSSSQAGLALSASEA